MPFHNVMDSKHLSTALSPQQNIVGKSVHLDVNKTRYEFRCGIISNIVGIPGKINLAGPGTKADSPLMDALQLMFFERKLCMDFYESEW